MTGSGKRPRSLDQQPRGPVPLHSGQVTSSYGAGEAEAAFATAMMEIPGVLQGDHQSSAHVPAPGGAIEVARGHAKAVHR